MSKLRIGETDFMNPIFMSLSNLAFTVGVVMPVSLEISHEMTYDHLLTMLSE